MNQSHGKTNNRSWLINDPEQLKFSGDSGIQEFKNGMATTIWNGDMSDTKSNLLYFDVAGYNQLTFTVAVDKPCTVVLYDQDGNVHTRFDFDGGITTKTVYLNGAKKIALYSNGRANIETSFGDHGQVFFYDATLS